MIVDDLSPCAFLNSASAYLFGSRRLSKSREILCYSSRSNIDPLKGNKLRCSVEKPVGYGKSQLLTLPTGVDLEVVKNISKKPTANNNPPIVFIHGSKHAAWSFRFFQPYFAEKAYSSYAMSWRGNGKSIMHSQEKNPAQSKAFSFTVDQCVEDIGALLNCLGLTQLPILIGHSLGGYVIQKWALQNPDKYEALILMSSIPPSGNSGLVRRVFFKRGFLNVWRITRAFVTEALSKNLELCRNVFFSSKEAQNFDSTIEGDDVLRSYMTLYGSATGRIDVRTLTPLVHPDIQPSRPVLSLGGSEDVITDDVAVHEIAEFWSGDAMVVPGAPHNLMLYSGWRSVADTIFDWVEKKR